MTFNITDMQTSLTNICSCHLPLKTMCTFAAKGRDIDMGKISHFSKGKDLRVYKDYKGTCKNMSLIIISGCMYCSLSLCQICIDL